MFPFAPQGAAVPVYADLPPTLLPHAIALAAPPQDRRRNLLLAGTVYAALAAGALGVHQLQARAPLPPPPKSAGDVDLRVWEVKPALPAAPPVARPSSPPRVSPVPVAPERTFTPPLDIPPDQVPTTRPTLDQSGLFAAVKPGPVAEHPSGTGDPGTGPAPQVRYLDMDAVRVLHQVNPAYPAFARMAHVQGAVVLFMTIDTQGVPASVKVIEGHPALQEEALRAARQWRFEPARVDGQAVPASFRLTLNFRLL